MDINLCYLKSVFWLYWNWILCGMRCETFEGVPLLESFLKAQKKFQVILFIIEIFKTINCVHWIMWFEFINLITIN